MIADPAISTLDVDRTVQHATHSRYVVWGPIIAGTVAALSVQLVLTLLGVGVGAAATDPLTDAEPTRGLGIGAAIWSIVSGLIAFGIGGFLAGNMLGPGRPAPGAAHGFMSWALAAVLGVTLAAISGAMLAGGAAIGVPSAITVRNQQNLGTSLAGALGGGGRTDARLTDPGATTRDRGATAGATTPSGLDVNEAAAAEDAADAVAQSALWATIALIAGAVGATVGGAMGRRREPLTLVDNDTRVYGRINQPRPAAV